jgi:hypothetical protein
MYWKNFTANYLLFMIIAVILGNPGCKCSQATALSDVMQVSQKSKPR